MFNMPNGKLQSAMTGKKHNMADDIDQDHDKIAKANCNNQRRRSTQQSSAVMISLNLRRILNNPAKEPI